jgi:hypothetical protein
MVEEFGKDPVHPFGAVLLVEGAFVKFGPLPSVDDLCA